MSWSPSPSLDITTAATGQLCRWVFHPLEQQLALLHQTRACAITHSVPQTELTMLAEGPRNEQYEGQAVDNTQVGAQTYASLGYVSGSAG